MDRWGNPVPGPNARRDLRALRGWFFEQLTTLTVSNEAIDVAALESRVQAIEAGAPALLAEAPYRAVLGAAYARALARLGHLADGVRVLEGVVAGTHFEEARFRLVQFLALGGRLDEAAGLATKMVNDPWSERGVYDGAHLLVRLAIERRDEGVLPMAFSRLRASLSVASEEVTRLNATLWARAHLWWDEVGEADDEVRAWNYAPDGDAVACLARWRRGRTRAEDPEAMRRAIAENPDAAWEGQVALAAAQLGTGNAREALATLERTIGTLETVSRDDFMNWQVLDLARGLHVKALLAAGEKTRALAEARRVRPSLRDGLLPAILVDEVLHSGT